LLKTPGAFKQFKWRRPQCVKECTAKEYFYRAKRHEISWRL